jgi:hypothetical protein
MSQVQNIVIVGGTSFLRPVSYEANKAASCAGHTLANTLVPLLPPTHRIILIDASAYSYYPVAALRGAVVPGWEEKITVPLTTENVFGKSSPHQVVAPNKVVELKEGSLMLEKEFEGSTELPFFVRLNSTYDPHRSADNRNAYLLLVLLNHTLCEEMPLTRSRSAGPVGLEYAGVRLHHLSMIHAD